MILLGSCDRIPRGEITIDDCVVMDGLECGSVGFEERLRFCSLLGLDLFCLAPRVSHSPERLPQPGDFVWPDLKRWVEESGLFTFAVLDGAFGWGVRIFGYQRFFALTLRSKEALRDFNAQVEALNLELSVRLAGEGIHGLILADDIAHSSGLFVSPNAMAEHFLPSLSRQAGQILRLGVPLFFHSDGDFMRVLPQISAIGFHGFHCIDPECKMNLAAVRSEVGNKACLWGTISARQLEACRGTDGCDQMVGKIKGDASSGSFILGTTSGLFKGIRVDTLRTIYDLADLPLVWTSDLRPQTSRSYRPSSIGQYNLGSPDTEATGCLSERTI